MVRMKVLFVLAFLPAQLLAQETLERRPSSDRGAVALALTWCAAALVVIIASLRGLGKSSPSIPTINSPKARLLSRAGSFFGGTLEVTFGVLLVVGLSGIVKLVSTPKITLPSGWKIIRPAQEVSALALQNDTLWAGGIAGLTAIDRRTSQVLQNSAGDPVFRYVKDLIVDREGGLWVAHGEGLARFSHGQWRTFSQADGMPPGPTLALLQDRAGNIWVGTEQGAFRYDGRAFTIGLASSPVSVMFEDREGVTWIGSDAPGQGGLWSFDGNAWRSWSVRDGLAHNSVNAITQERSGAIWFATGFGMRGGATRVDHGVWTTLTRKEGLAGAKVRSVFQDREGRLWFGSEYEGIAVTDGHAWRILTPRDGLAGHEVKKMLQDPDGVYWLGTENGVSRIEKFDWQAVQKGSRR
jgi:ligand-binding sensor domain-containing protein